MEPGRTCEFRQGEAIIVGRSKGDSQVDVAVVGSGPGGATVARQLARAGAKVMLLERGRDYRRAPHYGTYLGALIYTDRHSFLYTKEKLNIIRPLMVGGATSMFCGSASLPPEWLKSRYGIDLSVEANETVDELGIEPLPAELRGQASTRIAAAGKALGYAWQPMAKFMRPARSPQFDCGAKCMLGCRCQAKWNAAEYVDEAVQAGAQLWTSAKVERVLTRDGQCLGVAGLRAGAPFTVHTEMVVLAAGGIGSPRILQVSGFPDAGIGLAMDTTVMIYGFAGQRGIGLEPPMTWAWENLEEGYMLSTLVDPWLNYPLTTIFKGLGYALHWPKWHRLLGVMIKLKDEISGGVYRDGTISKPMTTMDDRRLKSAEAISRRILREAGADPATLFMTPQRGTHPSATVRIGDLVDENLQTQVSGLYVCDASVFPEALGQPTVLTIVAFAKRLSKHLLLDSALGQKLGSDRVHNAA